MKAIALMAGISTAMTLTVSAQERKLTREQLPAAVVTTVDHETQGAMVNGFSSEREHGVRVYEAETMVNGHSRDLQISADGTLTEIEEEVSMASLASEVRSALEVKAKGAKIQKVESLTKNGKLVAYEASTVKNGKKGEIQVGPTGKALAHEE